MNNDNRSDIVITNFGSSTIGVFSSCYGNLTFAPQVTYGTITSVYGIGLADFNKDQNLDIAFTNYYNNSVSIFRGYGNGTFGAPVSFSSGTQPISLVVGDMNNDTILDIVVANYGDNTVSVLLGYGNLTFAPQKKYPDWH